MGMGPNTCEPRRKEGELSPRKKNVYDIALCTNMLDRGNLLEIIAYRCRQMNMKKTQSVLMTALPWHSCEEVVLMTYLKGYTSPAASSFSLFCIDFSWRLLAIRPSWFSLIFLFLIELSIRKVNMGRELDSRTACGYGGWCGQACHW